MYSRLLPSVWLALTLMAVSAEAQTHPLRAPEPSGGAVEPDQPVRPEVPTLVPRVPQQPAAAQPGPQQPQPPFTLTAEEEAQVDRVLSLWEKRNRDVKTFDCEFKRWTYDKVFGPPDQPKHVDTGILKYAAPDRGMFRVEKTEKAGKDIAIENGRAEHWISDGKSIFEYNHLKRQLTEHKLPPELQGKAIIDSPLPFLFGADAQKLRQRYWIKIVQQPDVADKILLLAYPRYQQDAANFYCAEFIVVADGMAPYALNLIQPNRKDRIAYQFYNVVVNDPLRLFKGDPFRAGLPLGWQKIVEEPPAQQAQRVPADGPR